MDTPESELDSGKAPEFQNVAECLYRHQTSGIYYAIVKVGGKQIKRSFKTTDRKTADRMLADFRKKAERLSKTTSARQITFREIAGRWLESVKPHLKASSHVNRTTTVSELCKLLGSLTLIQITPRKCEEWANERGQHIAPRTYNNESSILRVVLDYAIREKMLIENPAAGLKRRKPSRHHPSIPTKDQFATLIKTLRVRGGMRNQAAHLAELLAYSGMRVAEASELRWRDVNFDSVKFTVTGGELGTKNGQAREVPLFPDLRAFLGELKVPYSPAPDDYVVGIEMAREAIKRACRVSGLPKFTHHSLRHYFCSNAIEAGVDFKTIAGWLGHSDGGILVAKTYGHLRDTHSAEMAKRMDFRAS